MSDPALAAALVDVRKAYRLVWAYQRRVYDIVDTLHRQFDDMGFYWWITQHASRPPQSGTNPVTGRWAWDMLPMYEVCYLFLRGDTDRNVTMPGQWMFEVRLVSDDGFGRPKGRQEPDPKDFEPAEASSSYLTLYAWYCLEQAKLNWLNGVWENGEWPEDGCVTDCAKVPFRIFGKRIDLVDLPDKAAVLTAAATFKAEASAALGVTLS